MNIGCIFIYLNDQNEKMKMYATVYTVANDVSDFFVELDNSF